MTQSSDAFDNFIYEEMMVHPLFFTHPNLRNVALIANNNAGLLREILKHQNINSIWQEKKSAPDLHDRRINLFAENISDWLQNMPASTLDAIIIGDVSDSKDFSAANYQQIFAVLNADGIFIQQTHSWFDTQEVRQVYQALQKAGFQDLQILNFPQPHLPAGSRTAIMAVKNGTFKRIREKDIFNKNFTTKFYNFDMHKAALALPEFVREELAI
jgi:spermidine synthase